MPKELEKKINELKEVVVKENDWIEDKSKKVVIEEDKFKIH